MFRSESSAARAPRAMQRNPAEWLAMVEDPAFRALVARKRRYLLTGWLLVASGYLALACGAARAPDFYAEPLLGELNIGMTLVLGEMLLCLLVAWLYVRRAGPQFDLDAEALALRFRRRIGSETRSDSAADSTLA